MQVEVPYKFCISAQFNISNWDYNDNGCRATPSPTCYIPSRDCTMDPQEPNRPGPSTPPKPNPASEQPPNANESTTGDATMQEAAPKEPQEEPLPQEILELSADDILARARLIENEIKVSCNPPHHSSSPPRTVSRDSSLDITVLRYAAIDRIKLQERMNSHSPRFDISTGHEE